MNLLEFQNNQTVEYNEYVHFAYYIGKYLIQHCKGEMCNEKLLIEWYSQEFRGIFHESVMNPSKVKLICESLINNLINDECVLVVGEEAGTRIIKKHPEFFVWAWQNNAKTLDVREAHSNRV